MCQEFDRPSLPFPRRGVARGRRRFVASHCTGPSNPRQDLGRAVHQALDAIDGAIEKTRAAADHADDAYGDPNPVSGELEDLLGMLRIWYAAASMVLDDIDDQ